LCLLKIANRGTSGPNVLTVARDRPYDQLGVDADNARGEPTDLEAVRVVANNNASWCDAVCRSHGLTATFDRHAWASPQRTPPLYPDAVTLSAACVPDYLLDRIDDSPGSSVKDSFATLDLSAHGFRILFDSHWIMLRRPVVAAIQPPDISWRVVASTTALEHWHEAWTAETDIRGLFLPTLLNHPGVSVLGAYRNNVPVAGAVLFRSHGVVGLTNYFSDPALPGNTLNGCLAAARVLAPDLPIVGYEHGPALAACVTQGFDVIGALRVWACGARYAGIHEPNDGETP
jgi:hypothetical protein